MRFTLPAHLTGANRVLWKHDILLDRPLHVEPPPQWTQQIPDYLDNALIQF